MGNYRRYLLVAALLSLIAFGCGKIDHKNAVAVIDGEYVITVDEFLYRYERALVNTPQEQGPIIDNYDDARLFLDKIITGRLLEIEAEERGYDDEYLRKTVGGFRANLLRDKLREDIRNGIRLNDTRLSRFYRALGERRFVRVIFAGDAKAIETAKKELDREVPFTEVASIYNEDPELRSSGGDVGTPVIYDGGFFARRVFTIEDEGDFTDVIYSQKDNGYLIIQLTAKEPYDAGSLPEYSLIKADIRAELLDIETEKWLYKLLDDRFETAEVEYNEEVYEAFFSLPQKELRERYSRKGVVVCTADGEPVYFDEWFEGVGVQSGMSDPALDDFKRKQPTSIKELMDNRLNLFIRSVLVLAEAEERGLDRRGDFVREVNDFRAGLLIDRLNDEVFVSALPLPTNDERLQYFETNVSEFTTPEKMSGYYFLTDGEEIALNYYNRVRSGEDIVRVISAIGVNNDSNIKAGFFDIYRDATVADTPLDITSEANPLLSEYAFEYGEGTLSPLVNLEDGRFLFFVNFAYTPYSEPDINDPATLKKINDQLYSEMHGSSTTDYKYKLWFEELRDKRRIDISEAGLMNAFRKIQNQYKM
ncbi:MAG: hypothetical protein GY771_15340 [bacterium]|nr:hypothetical protein [bacterium]